MVFKSKSNFWIESYKNLNEIRYEIFSNYGSWDYDLAEIVNMSVNDYRDYLIKNFNAKKDKSMESEIFFSNENDAIKAAKWLQKHELVYILSR